jgi:DNA repair exonuclease SbcCD ATPase subunit
MAPRAATLKTNARAGGASDSEDDLATTPSAAVIDANDRTKRNAPKPKAIKPVARMSADKPATKRKVAAPRKPRQALQDKTNVQAGSDTEEVEAFDDDLEGDSGATKAKRAKTSAARKTTAKTATGVKRGRTAKTAQPPPEPLKTIPETQPDPQDMEDVEQSIEVDPDSMNIAQVPTPPPAARFVQRTAQLPLLPRPSSRAPSVPVAYIPQRERSGSAVAPDRRGGDPELRRALNELTKKYEDLQTRYASLEEIGKTSADSNFARLKSASDQKSRDADALITSLKKDLCDVRKACEPSKVPSAEVTAQIAALQTAQTTLLADRDDARNKLLTAQNASKALEAKLLAARQQIATQLAENKNLVDAAKNPRHAAPILASNATEAQREARMKENLYADLTGLIVRNVKRLEGEDVYDCIQTGRNGSEYPGCPL